MAHGPRRWCTETKKDDERFTVGKTYVWRIRGVLDNLSSRTFGNRADGERTTDETTTIMRRICLERVSDAEKRPPPSFRRLRRCGVRVSKRSTWQTCKTSSIIVFERIGCCCWNELTEKPIKCLQTFSQLNSLNDIISLSSPTQYDFNVISRYVRFFVCKLFVCTVIYDFSNINRFRHLYAHIHFFFNSFPLRLKRNTVFVLAVIVFYKPTNRYLLLNVSVKKHWSFSCMGSVGLWSAHVRRRPFRRTATFRKLCKVRNIRETRVCVT